ncbi:MAG: hypothetical protein KIS66_10875 [Fimbriimonadaceae bacterium]|nr:hypothetical protein [Fimbriimonadaceae bacterium]
MFLPVASQPMDRTFLLNDYNRLQLLGTERDEATGAVDSVYTELATSGLARPNPRWAPTRRVRPPPR